MEGLSGYFPFHLVYYLAFQAQSIVNNFWRSYMVLSDRVASLDSSSTEYDVPSVLSSIEVLYHALHNVFCDPTQMTLRPESA